MPFPTRSAAGAIARRWLLALALVAATGLLLAHFLSLAGSAWALIRYPFGVDYGEGIVWQQMRNMLRGTAYRPIGVYPAIVYHYPPVYHLTAGTLAALSGMDGLAAGRTVSWAATLGTAAITGGLAARIGRQGEGRPAVALCATLSALIFLSCEPVIDWAPLMRVDMLSCLLSVAGLAFSLRAIGRRGAILPAALCFVLAMYTKQVSLAAPIAGFLGLLAVRPRRAWALAGLCFAIGGAALAALTVATDGGFPRHILLYNVNRVRPELLAMLVYPVRVHLIYITLACAGAVLLARRVRAWWSERRAHAAEVGGAIAALAYFAIKTLMLTMIVKSGSNLNYIIEYFCAAAILAGVTLLPALQTTVEHFRGTPDPRRSIALPAALLLAVAFQTRQLPRLVFTQTDAHAQAERMRPLVDLIRATPGPVIADEMTLLIRAGRDVAWEPAIEAELGNLGRYDQAGFVRLVRQRRFGLFITEGGPGDRMFGERYNPPVAAAILAAYPVTREIDGYTVRAPR